MEPIKTLDEILRLTADLGRMSIVPFTCERCGKPSEKTLRKLREKGFTCKACLQSEGRREYEERVDLLEIRAPDDLSALKKVHPKQRVSFTCERCGKPSSLEFKKVQACGLICASCKKSSGNTKFERSDKPIHISTFAEAEALCGKYLPQQKVSFSCVKCGKTSEKYLMNVDERMTCRGCLTSIAQKGTVRRRDPNAKRQIEKRLMTVTCPQCGKSVTRQARVMTDYLCRKCRIDRTAVEKFGSIEAYNLAKTKKQEETCLKKYGVKCFAQTPRFTMLKQAKYEYAGKRFDSSWELAYFIVLEDQRVPFTYQPEGVPYVDSLGKKYVYYPDFKVNGRYVEIKGGQFLGDDGKTLVSPYDDIKKESRKRKDEAKSELMTNLGVEIISTREIQPVLNKVRTLYGKDFLKSHRVPRRPDAED